MRISADTLVVDGAVRANGGLGGAGIGSSSGKRLGWRRPALDHRASCRGMESSAPRVGRRVVARVEEEVASPIYYQDISGFDTSNISARGGQGGGNGGAGTIFLKGTAQANGDLIIDNVGVVSQHSTGLRSVAPGVSTALDAKHPHRQRSQLLRAQPCDGQGGIDRP